MDLKERRGRGSIMARMDVSTQSAVILSPVMGRYMTFQGLMLAVKWLLKMQKYGQ